MESVITVIVCNTCEYQQFDDGPITCPRCGESSWFNSKEQEVRKQNQKMGRSKCKNLCRLTKRRVICFLLALAFFVVGVVMFFKMDQAERYYSLAAFFIVGVLWIIQGLDIFPCCRKCTAC